MLPLAKNLGKLVLILVMVLGFLVLAAAVRYWVWIPSPTASFYEEHEVLIWGHRGAPEAAPENTISAFQAAVSQGAHGVELDVMFSSDGEIVVIHDYTLDKTTDGSGPVKDYSLAELKRLDAGSRFSEEFSGEPIPTLQEVIDALDSSVFLNIEIKSETPATDGLEKAVAHTVAQNNLYDRVIVSSFNPISLIRVKMADKRIDVGLIYAPDLANYLSEGWFVPILRPEALHPRFDMVDEDYMEWARKKGFQVSVWTVNETEDMKRMLDLGVDSIITDRPDSLKQLLIP